MLAISSESLGSVWPVIIGIFAKVVTAQYAIDGLHVVDLLQLTAPHVSR